MAPGKTFLALSAAILFMLPGCASIAGSPTQAIMVSTKDSQGNNLEGPMCVLANSVGRWSVRAPGTVVVGRSSESLKVTCTTDGGGSGATIVESKIRAVAAGNILIGGVVGIAVDHISGAGYSFPEDISITIQIPHSK
jgi:hypothetical protein